MGVFYSPYKLKGYTRVVDNEFASIFRGAAYERINSLFGHLITCANYLVVAVNNELRNTFPPESHMLYYLS
jgi:hypothetical protein